MNDIDQALKASGSRNAHQGSDRLATLAWIVLVLLTIAIWGLAEFGEGGRIFGIPVLMAIIVIAFVKIYLIVQAFMEVRNAPRALQLTLAGWTIATCLGVLFFIGKIA